MRRKITITPKPQPYNCTIHVCDLCGKESEPGEDLDDDSEDIYGQSETTIEGRFGVVWPNGDDDRTTTYLDVCPRSSRHSGSSFTETANCAEP